VGWSFKFIMFERELEKLEQQNLLRGLVTVESQDGPFVSVQGRTALLMCSNDYLGLAHHPALRRAALEAMDKYGFGSGASRLVSGTGPLHRLLEERIAQFKRTDAAIVFNSGYAANTGVVPAVAGEGDVVFSDSLNHASIIDGCRLSRAKTQVYRHKDMHHLEELLRHEQNAGRRLIVTDGVFSMDGDIAPLLDIVLLAEKYDALIMVDDAHGCGVLGKTGRGTVEHFGLENRVQIQMGTLGKAFGSFGAYVAGSRGLIDYLVNSARSFVFSTALPAAVCAASVAAIEIVEREQQLRLKLLKNSERFCDGLVRLGMDAACSGSPIIPLMVGDPGRALKAAERLLELGVYATAIRPPTVPVGTSRIRMTVTALMDDSHIDAALAALKQCRTEALFS
jgi:glycine C-acetyltransferase